MCQMQLFLSRLCLSILTNTFTLKKSYIPFSFKASGANDKNCATEKYWRHVFYLAYGCTKFEYIFLKKFWICCCGLLHRIAGWIGGSQDCTGLYRIVGSPRLEVTHSQRSHIDPTPIYIIGLSTFSICCLLFQGEQSLADPCIPNTFWFTYSGHILTSILHTRGEWSSFAFDSNRTAY